MKKLISVGIIGIISLSTVYASSTSYFYQPNLEWELLIGGSDFDACYSVQQTDDGGYIFAGGSYSFGPGFSDVWIIKTDSYGNVVWNNTYGGLQNESCYCIQKTSDDCYVVAGKTKVADPDDYNAFLMKIDDNGNSLWQKTYGDEKFDAGWWVEPTVDEGFILVGITESKGLGNGDIWVIKTDVDGEIMVDHTNRNRLDNRKNNIRICYVGDNNKNRSLNFNSKSGVIGVSWRSKRNKWRAEICKDGKSKTIGEFKNIEDAIKSRLKAEKELFDEFAPQKYLFTKYNIN